jgi:hypothetical protein
MTRNATSLLAVTILLSALALPAQRSAAREELGATQPSTTGGSPVSVAPEHRWEPADLAARARDDHRAGMARLFSEVCSTGQESADTGGLQQSQVPVDAREEASRLRERQAEVRRLCQPQTSEFIIAIIPDPVHTRLALFFDRLLEVVQQALQDKRYRFVRALMPWDHLAHQEPSALKDRLGAEAYAAAKGRLAGLMTFRRPAPDSSTGQQHLFVLIVGESPTGGVAKLQFRDAIQWITATTGDLRPQLRILGPTFSGSLASLADLLSCTGRPCYGSSYVFGSVSNRTAIDSFLDKDKKDALAVTFASFQESSAVMIDRFRAFLSGRGYKPARIALLSEDETAYGGAGEGPSDGERRPARTPPACADCVKLYFPREISRLRAAYQSSDAKDANTEARETPRDVLPLNLEISGADDDTVPSFSKQTPLSQEGVLLGIVSELRRHDVEFIVLRATDPLDLLFLSHYLAAAYPRGRIVTLGADMLFRREVEDRHLFGILALSTYALSSAANHEFRNYLSYPERIFPSTVEAGTYNALRSLLAISPAEGPPSDVYRRYTIGAKDLDLYQYGWREGWCPTCDPAAYNSPTVHLLALGRDEYWPIAHLGPSKDEVVTTLLPWTQAPQFRFEHRQDGSRIVEPLFFLPISWEVADLAAFVLALGFAASLWWSSIRSTSQPLVQLAPAVADARAAPIAAAAFFLECILLLLLYPLVAGGGIWRIEHAAIWQVLSWTAAGAVLVVGLLDLFDRARLEERSARAGSRALPRARLFSMPFVFILASGLLLAVWIVAEELGGADSVRRSAVLRSLQLTSGLSPMLPMLLMAGAGLWWAFQVSAGSALLDGRSPRLPQGARNVRVRALAYSGDGRASGNQHGWKPCGRVDYIITELLCALPPRTSPGGHYLHYLVLIALAGGVVLLLGGGRKPLMTLEDAALERLLLALFLLAGTWITGTTARLWEIWLKTRQLLVLLDSRPLRGGFHRLEGFSCKSLWRVSLVTTTEFQSLLARVSEARDRALTTLGESASDIACDRKALLALWEEILEPRRHRIRDTLRDWAKRRKQERRLIQGFGRLQLDTALAAGRALDFLAERWGRDQERPRGRPGEPAPDDPGIRACEQFVCLVYVSFLLVVLMRIRSLMMAVGGMYVLVWVGINSYPFQPRASIAALSTILLLYILAVATTIFAQMHRDVILSSLTNTTPGELGKDFWIRTASFAALPVLSYLAAQFPEVNRFLYSWLEPAIQALHK